MPETLGHPSPQGRKPEEWHGAAETEEGGAGTEGVQTTRNWLGHTPQRVEWIAFLCLWITLPVLDFQAISKIFQIKTIKQREERKQLSAHTFSIIIILTDSDGQLKNRQISHGQGYTFLLICHYTTYTNTYNSCTHWCTLRAMFFQQENLV